MLCSTHNPAVVVASGVVGRLVVLLVLLCCAGTQVIDARLSPFANNDNNDKDSKGNNIAPTYNHNKINPSNNTSLCERIHPEDLPPECICSEPGPYSLVVECLKPFNSTMFNDTIGMKIMILPCDPNGASVSIDVTERDHHIDYPISGIRANEESDYPIPGLAVVVPGLGHVGMDVAVLVTGNLDSLTLKIGLNACVALAQKIVCASSIPGISAILPWYVLSGTYKFGDVCGGPDENQHAKNSIAKEEATLFADLAVE